MDAGSARQSVYDSNRPDSAERSGGRCKIRRASASASRRAAETADPLVTGSKFPVARRSDIHETRWAFQRHGGFMIRLHALLLAAIGCAVSAQAQPPQTAVAPKPAPAPAEAKPPAAVPPPL